jgi:hypothetical protein
MGFSINSTVGELMADENARAVVERHVPGATSHPLLYQALYMTVREIAMYPESGLTDDKLRALLADLERL